MSSQKISVIIPVLNEENAIAKVITDIPKTVRTPDEKTEATVQEIIVVDNGCTDNTAAIASRNGARVITEPRRGYGVRLSRWNCCAYDDPARYRRFS